MSEEQILRFRSAFSSAPLTRLPRRTFHRTRVPCECKDVVVSLMATLAKQERLRISERTKAGLQRARRAENAWEATDRGEGRKAKAASASWAVPTADCNEDEAESLNSGEVAETCYLGSALCFGLSFDRPGFVLRKRASCSY